MTDEQNKKPTPEATDSPAGAPPQASDAATETPAADETVDADETPTVEQSPPVAGEPPNVPPTPTPTPQPAFAPRKLVRRAEGKMLAGVCAGLAAYFGVDPVLVRVVFVLLAIVGGGSGLIAYIVLWLVTPMAAEGEPLPPASQVDWLDSSSVWRWTSIILIIAAVALISNNIWHFRASLFWGLVLLGCGVALWSRELHVRGNGDKPEPPVAAAVPARAEPIAGGGGVTTPLPPVPPTRPAPRAPIASPQSRPPSALGRMVVGAAALAVGTMFLLDNLRAVHVTARMGMAVLLAVVGLGLIVGSLWGHARWLIIPGSVIALIVLGVSMLPDAGPRTGNVVWAPATLADLRTQYRHGAGNATLDLTRVEFDSEPRTIEVRLAFGNLEIIVPDDVPTLVRARARGGNIEVFGREANGFDPREVHTEPGDDNIGLLTIRTNTGFGNTEVRRPRAGDNVRIFDRDGILDGVRDRRIRIGTRSF